MISTQQNTYSYIFINTQTHVLNIDKNKPTKQVFKANNV